MTTSTLTYTTASPALRRVNTRETAALMAAAARRGREREAAAARRARDEARGICGCSSAPDRWMWIGCRVCD